MSVQPVRLIEFMRCYKKVPELFQVTAEDIQREKPPFWTTRVCVDCLRLIPDDARLESTYHFKRASAELALLVPSVLGALTLALFLAASITGASALRAWHAPFFISAATSLTGIKLLWSWLGLQIQLHTQFRLVDPIPRSRYPSIRGLRGHLTLNYHT